MFDRWGQIVVRLRPVVLGVWVVAVGAAALIAPPLEDVVQTGEFKFLPADSPSLVAERQFAEAFPKDARASTIAVVVRRSDGAKELTDDDLTFVDDADPADDPATADELSERLLALFPGAHRASEDADPAEPNGITLRTYQDRSAGRFLLSEDRKATLVLLELGNEFMDAKNRPIVKSVEKLLFEDPEFRSHVPEGIEFALSGTAVVGRDMMQAARDSAKQTERWTIGLVVLLLVLIYRAPLLALVPLSTVFVSVLLTMKLLCLAASWGWVVLFSGIESYVTVLLYGAGVDYCLFLIARYKEEFDHSANDQKAVSDAIGHVGAAIAASAGTVICGIGMMIFAEFGKFHEAGIAISFGLVIVLAAALSFTPALLGLTGRWVFWPQAMRRTIKTAPSSTPSGALDWMQSLWDHVGALLLRWPLRVWLASVLAMLPFAVVGVIHYRDLSYGLLSDLPPTAPSVVGTNIVGEHFPAGTAGPITVLVGSQTLDFTLIDEGAGIEVIDNLTVGLRERMDRLQLADVRSVSHPFGGDENLVSMHPARRRVTKDKAVARYVSHADGAERRMTRLEITALIDPFARDSIAHLTRLEHEIRRLLPPQTEVHVLGATASIRDLKSVTDRDQVRINLLVILGVFVILVALLRQPGVCFYLIVSVLFSYLATLGVTYLAYWWYDGADFAGLDWKVPMFLFTILIAVGEDYNIFLMSRTVEEQNIHGPVPGVVHALSKTGRIISSCGIIMAGTFASLAAGSLKGMSQLGFALAFGVLLDTFVVRPILVPAYLVLLHSGRMGTVGRWLGSRSENTSTPPPTAT